MIRRLLPLLIVASASFGVPLVAEDKVPPGILVLDDADPDFSGKETYGDNVWSISAQGKLNFKLSGFNGCESIGSSHLIAADPKRDWFWVAEIVSKRLHKIDRQGKELLAIDNVEANAIAVDPATGNLWALTTHGVIDGGETAVYDASGKKVGTYNFGGYDIAYDAKSLAFWIAGRNLTKMDAQTGRFLFAKEITTWCASSLDVHTDSGTVWVAVRRHEQVAGSENRLLSFNNNGMPQLSIDLGDTDADHPKMPFHVSVNQRDGSVWLTLFRQGVRRYSLAGELKCDKALWAMAAEADPETDCAWVVIPQGLVRLGPDGTILQRFDFNFTKLQAWISAF